MAISFCALIYRPTEVSRHALAHGMAVVLAGWDVAAPTLTVCDLDALPGWSVAFYRSGAKGLAKSSELDHAVEVFDDELPPGLAVHDAAESPAALVYSIVYSDEIIVDDVAKFAEDTTERRFVRDGEEGIEAGVQTPLDCDVTPLELPEIGDVEALLRPHRGSTFLSHELGLPILPLLVRALFEGGIAIEVRFFDASPASIVDEVTRLNRVLGRTNGRGAFTPPKSVAGRDAPPSYEAFVEAYDWADPSDPRDLYRELSIGRIDGALRFLRSDGLSRFDTDPHWKSFAMAGLFPIAMLGSSSLGGSNGPEKIVALAADGESISIVDKTEKAAGTTFAELLRYLALGWKTRDDVEEDLIVALMLRAKVRIE